MIGDIDPSQKKVTVIGAGIAGLLAAYELDRKGFEVSLLEAANRSGGLIQTSQHEPGISEHAAHSFLATAPVRELCREIGVELLEVNPGSRARMVLRAGRMRRFPLKAGEAIGAFFRAYFKLAPRNPELTVKEWGLHFLGPAATRYLITPFVAGIYGVRPEDLSVKAAFPALMVPHGQSLVSFFAVRRLWLRLSGRLPAKSRGPMVAPRLGMGSIADSLDRHLNARLGSRFRKSEKVTELAGLGGNIVLAVPAFEAARLLREEDPSLSEALSGIVYSSLVSVTAFVRAEDLERLPKGVGVLFPSEENRSALGILFNSSAFAGRVREPREMVSLTLIFSGDWRHQDDTALDQAVRRELEALFGFKRGASIDTVIHRYERAIPRYDAKLEKAWQNARAGWCARKGHVLFGNYSGQVSLRGMIEDARSLAAGLQPFEPT
ncbi:MAG: protoporphyrinogen oxidase [Oligoflexia bacterium]|nr:protoporphyrinogen oxidase [Oligoflexia bacterium]